MEFLSPLAPYYYTFYWFIVMFMTVSRFIALRRCSAYEVIENQDVYRPILIFTIFYIIFYGFRPVSVFFGDMVVYRSGFELLQNYGIYDAEGTEERTSDVIFYAYQRICALSVDIHVWFASVMFFYIAMMFSGCRKIDSYHSALLMLFCIGSFEFYPFSVNGIRNGVACSFAIMAVACLCKEEKIWAFVWSVFAVGCHKSAALPIATMVFSYFMVNKPKYMFIAWGGAIVLSLAIGGYIDSLLSAMTYDERLAQNIQGDDADGVVMEHRFRWDFLLYSSMPIILGWYTIFKRQMFDKTYLILLGTYIYANAFWVLAIRALFSNRIAYLSWFIYPIVLAYPLVNFPVFKKNHSEITAWILLGHFGFTTILWMLGKN